MDSEQVKTKSPSGMSRVPRFRVLSHRFSMSVAVQDSPFHLVRHWAVLWVPRAAQGLEAGERHNGTVPFFASEKAVVQFVNSP